MSGVNSRLARNSRTYPATGRAIPTRRRELVSYDMSAIHAVLDEALYCHIGFVVNNEPVVLPTIHVRIGEDLYLHGSTAARLMRSARSDPIRVCVTVTVVDGLVVGQRYFTHSLNYRSVVAHGSAVLVENSIETRQALTALVEHVISGRANDCETPNAQELAATALLRLPLTEVSLKSRTGPPIDPESDPPLPYWSGVIPVSTVFGPARSVSGVPTPGYVEEYARPARSAGMPRTSFGTLPDFCGQPKESG